MRVPKAQWNRADKAEKLRILKVYYPEIISQIHMEEQAKEVKESAKITDADSFMRFLKRS